MLISKRAKELLLQANALHPESRAHFVDEACGADRPLRDEVNSLLTAAGKAEDYFAQLSDKIGLAALADLEAQTPDNKEIGRWRLLRLLGRGGMGSVYLAERADKQFEKQAAIKILPIGAAGERARTRFLMERQILARLVHDNIARLLDGGVTDEGSPYFVMDYVEGAPIDAYCTQHKLSVRQRLELILDVARAVQFAHRNLIVHRDLKPGNVLVEDGGRVRLLDFGIAKVLESTADDEALTRTAQRPVTPVYASPEMLRGAVVDVTTDVYSIGVLMYLLLTDHLPLTYDGLTIPDMHTHAATSVPPPVSRFNKDLSGDIDAVVAKALAKLPSERYASMESLANDIRNHLDGMPVVAKTPSVMYRGRKFVRRHVVGVSFSLFAILALASVAGLAAYSAITAERQAREIALERDKAEQIKDFLLRIFEVSGPNEAKGETITARELLDEGTQRIRDELTGQPEIRAELMSAIAQVYLELSSLNRSKELFEEAASLHRQYSGETSAGFAHALEKLATLAERDGDFDKAEKQSMQALLIRKTLNEPAGLAEGLVHLGRIVQRQGDLDRGETYYREALDIHRSLYGPRHEQVARDLTHLGSLVSHKGQYEVAESLQREALSIRREVFGNEHLSLVDSLHNLGQVLVFQAQYEPAIGYFEEALAISRKLLPEGDSSSFYLLSGVADAHRKMGNLDLAEARYREAHKVLQRYFDADHPEEAIVLAQLGRISMLKGDPQSAEPLLRDGIGVLERSVPNHPFLPDMRITLGKCLTKIGHYAEAEEIIADSHRQLSEKVGPEHPRTLSAIENLVALYEASGDSGRAEHYRAMLAQ